ncbi:hypothetical protein BpHYR1_017276 [Brachionus plicatilis]|uniref:Uncharacterized protein n=1 Tax=Brachionus plicatilis TaxID=10195 RepID=A0A3M7RA37_BRAPC|nr:hypothetical protein BpHYR1_017276 [Brachionus plicatilis]
MILIRNFLANVKINKMKKLSLNLMLSSSSSILRVTRSENLALRSRSSSSLNLFNLPNRFLEAKKRIKSKAEVIGKM